MVTEFGKYLRVLRITNDCNAKRFSELMGISTSYLSAIENGKRPIPLTWETAIAEQFNLNEEQCANMHSAILASSDPLKVSLASANRLKKKVLAAVSRDNLDEETLGKLYKIINEYKEARKKSEEDNTAGERE